MLISFAEVVTSREALPSSPSLMRFQSGSYDLKFPRPQFLLFSIRSSCVQAILRLSMASRLPVYLILCRSSTTPLACLKSNARIFAVLQRSYKIQTDGADTTGSPIEKVLRIDMIRDYLRTRTFAIRGSSLQRGMQLCLAPLSTVLGTVEHHL